ncbi:MAG: type IV pili methyl-accepting chemotaxis transducer N-terminal domain-containing protein, partial [Arcobacteraceae bacterium]|nr:type IV pili methyl-accepting chemotaxis transducer N-terminal domain-containing protein [Arcobacteraceae bacterium]
LITFFIIITNIINSKAISKNKEFGKIINISGKQRMLSQKLVTLGVNYISIKNIKTKEALNNTISEMKKNHKYLLTKIFTSKLNN